MSEKPSTPLAEQSDKSKKYDRQLRLWGDHGQVSLESCSICLINASATGTETLKSLVLPGIGAITIIDAAKVTSQDLGNNFFLDASSIGCYRGEVALNNLLELNPDVCGIFVDQPLDEILSNQPDFFNNFTVVIANSVRESSLLELSEKLWDSKIPLVVIRSYGMIGYIRLQVVEHTIVESHPDNSLPDLRLERPLEALQTMADSLNFSTMTEREHSHVPYVLILLYFLTRWRQKHGQNIPTTYKEKQQLKDMIRKECRTRSGEPEENFEEALKAVNVCIGVSHRLPKGLTTVLEEAKQVTPCPSTPSFWLMAKAIAEFVDSEGGGELPVAGVIPDMTSESEIFIKVQNIYREQAALDVDCVYRRVQDMIQQLGPRKTLISEADVRSFCKNAAFLRVQRGKSIAQEYRGAVTLGDLGTQLENPESDLVWYVMLRAIDQFYSEFRAYPGFFKDQVETDIVRLKVCVNRLLSDWGCGLAVVKDDFVHEMCRFGAAEVHSVAAFVGGCAAHEVIKLVTQQYVPVANSFIYNAITGTSATFEL